MRWPDSSRPTAARRLLIVLGTLAWTTASGVAADPQPYTTSIAKTGDPGLDAAVQATSDLVNLQKTAPVSPFALLARARADVGRITTALHSFGYYLGSVMVAIDGLPVDDLNLPARLDAAPAKPPVAVVVTPVTGPLFHIGHVALTGQAPPDALAHLPIKPGDPARAAQVLAAGQLLQTRLQDTGHALSKVSAPVATLYVGSRTLDLAYHVEAGPRVDLGPITISGETSLNPGYLRHRLLLHPGEQYDPRKIEAARQDLAAVPAIAAVRVSEPDMLDDQGRLPVTVRVTERPLHVVDLGVAYSTDQGGSASASWTHRNLFGNAETLKLSAAATGLGGSATESPGYDLDALLTLPDWQARNQSLAFNLEGLRQYLLSYDQTAATASATLTRKLDPNLSVSGGVAFEVERIDQEDVVRHYTLPQLPLSLTWDNTGSLFDPIHGFRASLLVTPTYSLGGSATGGPPTPNAAFVIGQLSASTYLDLGKWSFGSAPGREVLALRGLVGNILGANTFDVPPDQRFYAGGGGTIRGWRYQSVGPTFPDDGHPVGGTSVEVGSVEYRQRLLKSYGFVVFVDAGEVQGRDAPYPGGGSLRVGAGAGLRYYTSLGPIRLDIATPLNRDPTIKTDIVEAYIGLGQAF
jgi:translocation and assembly module TamA